MTGFYITSVNLTGASTPQASVQFKKGLNLVSGPSDTGKTYIADCLDYVFGRSATPKAIPQAGEYENVIVNIKTYVGDQEYSLRRSLHGPGIELTNPDGSTQRLSAKHSADRDTNVSRFLLSLSGLNGKYIRWNRRGATRHISFRNLARLIVVNEEAVISSDSPIHTSNPTGRTAESSVFNLLLTGVDDSSSIEEIDLQETHRDNESKMAMLDTLIARVMQQLKDLENEGESESVQDTLNSVDSELNELDAGLETEKETITGLEQQRAEIWNEFTTGESQIAVLQELQARFRLLVAQYGTDLARLQAIEETGELLVQLVEDRCPICGALDEHSSVDHVQSDSNPTSVAQAARAEAEKIRTLSSELGETIQANESELQTLMQSNEVRSEKVSETRSQLDDELRPKIKEIIDNIKAVQDRKEMLVQIVRLQERVNEYQVLRDELAGATTNNADAQTTTNWSGQHLEMFALTAQSILESWHIPDLERVTFDVSSQDLRIGGRARGSFGKGVRALTHTAFNLALLSYCTNSRLAHPGFVLVDSPLVVYREPDQSESGFSPRVKDSFFRSLATRFPEQQVIILENETPSDDLTDRYNHIRFTATDVGRAGFIPTVDDSF